MQTVLTCFRSYGMTVSDGWLFLSSFIVTYNFTAMQDAFTSTGLTLGFYGGIAAVGWIWSILFIPETVGALGYLSVHILTSLQKDKTLEEIDEIFERPTMDIARENYANAKLMTKDILAFRWKKVFDECFNSPRRSSIVA